MYSKPRCRLQELSARFLACVRRELHTFCCTITWARSTAPFARGVSCAAERAPSRMQLRTPRAKLEPRSERKFPLPKSLLKTDKPEASSWRTETKFAHTSSHPVLIPG